MESVLWNRLWSFDRNHLVLDRVSGEEQPLNLNMHYGVFWVRIYDIPLMLGLEMITKKIRKVLRAFEEMDRNKGHRNGRFMKIKVTLDLNKPLKKGTMVRFKDKTHIDFFKYERLLTFCFMCGRISHQLKDCKALGDLSEEGYKDLQNESYLMVCGSKFHVTP